MLDRLKEVLDPAYILTGSDTAPWMQNSTGEYDATPVAVLRPGSTAEVSAILKLANETGAPVIPVSGNTGLTGGTSGGGAVFLSLDRMNAIREIRPNARIAVVEAGVIISNIHDAAATHDLIFPLTFGAKGSALIGGALSTNAGGSNVVRYGNTRDLCLGVEVVLPTGEVMDLMSTLHKDNTGYDLRHLVIGAEGTLGIITAAVLKLSPRPRAYATAMFAPKSLESALRLLNDIQAQSSGAVEAFELMPDSYMARHEHAFPNARPAFAQIYPYSIMVEIGATAPRDSTPLPDGSIPITNLLEEALAAQLESGDILDAIVAQNDTQRQEMWARREATAEVMMDGTEMVATDVALPLDQIAPFLEEIKIRVAKIDASARDTYVAHLGDGNIHYSIYPSRNDPDLSRDLTEAVEQLSQDLSGTFSAEHGIGVSKLSAMKRYKDPASLAAMRAIKAALDPNGILNPGKVLPADA